jgi:3-hydroxyisobutyrate dehydrogenase-like beta-hydroxyacid dehydrogenase
MTELLNLAFIGLGVMGGPMAGHLAKAGHRVTVYNRNAARAEAWVAANGGSAKPTPREAALDADIVFACVGNDDDLRQIATGVDGAFAGMDAGAIFVDHTTASASVARELAAEADGRGIAFLDAPVSGGQAGAEKGILTVMVGGVQALSEGIAFAEHAGLDPAKVIDVISKGAAQSWQMENRSPTMIDNRFDFGFAVDWMRKDLSIVLDEARKNGARVPVAALVDQFYAQVQAKGGNRWDTSSLVTLLRD